MQVLNGVPNDVVIRIFRSAPSELDALLSRLPQSLTGHAAIAKIPSLAGVCSPRQPGAVAGPDQGSCEGRTKFTLCAYINPAEHDVESDEDELVLAHDPMWLRRADAPHDAVLQVPDTSIFREAFALESREHTVVCPQLATISCLQGSTFCMPDFCCL